MARFSSGASSRLGKRCRNVSETVSLSSWGSEVNVHSDAEECSNSYQNVAKKRRSADSGMSPDLKDFTSSDDETRPSNTSGGTRGRRPKCFSRNAVLARENRLKKKKYIEDMENELQSLRRENSKLKVSLSGYTKDVELVRKENVYLRNVLANSKQLSQLLRSINVNCGLPSDTLPKPSLDAKRPGALQAPSTQPKVVVESAVPATATATPGPTRVDSDSCVPSSSPIQSDSTAARTMRKNYPIAVDDVSLSSSAPEDEDEDDLDVLFGSKDVPLDLDLNLNEASLEDSDYLGFGPNAFGDWLDGDEPLANVGVCLHVAKNKVSLEFCSSCNENALSSWSGINV